MKKFGIPALILGGVLLLGVWLYFVNQSQDVPPVDTQTVLQNAGRLILLPKGETPTIAVVNDPVKLENQPFFTHAKKGDVVLAYPRANRAYLYSISEDRIISVVPINPSLEVPAPETPVPIATSTKTKK